jgi:hypothetical protein
MGEAFCTVRSVHSLFAQQRSNCCLQADTTWVLVVVLTDSRLCRHSPGSDHA